MSHCELWGYDFDGVLAAPPPSPPKKWGLMTGEERRAWNEELGSFYARTSRVMVPKQERFIVITARKERYRDICEKWLRERLPGKSWELHMLDTSRSIENVVAFKGKVIREAGITDYVEDNKKVVDELAKLGLPCRVYYLNSEWTKRRR